MIKIVYIVCFLAFAYCDNIPFTDCDSKYDLKAVYIQNCKKLPCPMYPNEVLNVTVKMNAEFFSKSLEQSVYFIMQGIRVPATSTPGPCTQTRPCPVNVNADASFSAQLQIPKAMTAPFTARLYWILTNEDNEKVLCFHTSMVACSESIPDDRCKS